MSDVNDIWDDEEDRAMYAKPEVHLAKLPELTEVELLRTRNAELEEKLSHCMNAYKGADEPVVYLETKLRAAELDNKRLREALENIKWHREPGGSPNKYQYEVEVIADRALQSPPDLSEVEGMVRDAERLQVLMNASGESYQQGAPFHFVGRLREYIDEIAPVVNAAIDAAKGKE